MANNKPKPTPTPPTDLAVLQASHSHLSTAAQLLDGFVHRNKNQHRGTRWWGPFDMLRRSVRKLVPDLGDAVQRAEYLSSSSSSSAAGVGPATKRRKPNNDKGAAAKRPGPGLERVEARAQWVHDVVVVKAYEAFTQLLADRQFAQLGLMLIGVLAQVEAAVAPFVRPAEPEEGGDETGPAPAQQVRRGAGTAAKGGGVAPPARGVEQQQQDDLGVAISRDELGDDDDDGVGDDAVVSGSRHSPPPKHAPIKEKRPEKGESKGKKRSRTEDAGASRTGKPEKPTRPESSKEEKKVKKKKKKKGGDEFDDLFSSLM